MLTIAKQANMALMFFLELGVYLSVGYWGFTVSSNWLIKILLGIGAPVLFAVIWGIFGSPKANIPIHDGWGRAVLEILWFGGGVAAAAASGLLTTAAVFAVLFAGNGILRIVWDQLPSVSQP